MKKMQENARKLATMLIIAVVVTSLNLPVMASVTEEAVTEGTLVEQPAEVTLSENLTPGLYVVSPYDANPLATVSKIPYEYIFLNTITDPVTFRLHGVTLGKWWKPSGRKHIKDIVKTDKEYTVMFTRPGCYTFTATVKGADGHYQTIQKRVFVLCPTPVYKAKIGNKKMLAACEPVIAIKMPLGKEAKHTKVNLAWGADMTKKINKMYSAFATKKYRADLWDFIKVSIDDESIVSGSYVPKKNTISLLPKRQGETDVTFRIANKYIKTFKVIVE